MGAEGGACTRYFTGTIFDMPALDDVKVSWLFQLNYGFPCLSFVHGVGKNCRAEQLHTSHYSYREYLLYSKFLTTQIEWILPMYKRMFCCCDSATRQFDNTSNLSIP